MPEHTPVTVALLDAHLNPIREDIRQLVSDQREFAEFMTGAIASQVFQTRLVKSRQFWVGVAVAMATGLVTAAGVILQLASR